MQDQRLFVNDSEYQVIRLLGKGKGGYSFLVSKDGRFFVLKQIHHEPCSYYQFNDKLMSEIHDYACLKSIGIRMPEFIEVDYVSERILKDYIEGATINELINQDMMKETYLDQVRSMSVKLREFNLNIDYFPTNFIVRNDLIYYVDYECNSYSEEWSFEHWGLQFWSKSNKRTK